MKIFILLLSIYTLSFSSDSLKSWIQDGSVKANIKYYYIETNKYHLSDADTFAHSNSVGGQFNYTTSTWNGLKLSTTFMTTNPFLLPSSIESSTLGQDDGRIGDDSSDGFSIMGEAYAKYNSNFFDLWYGRKVITTPMIGAKEARMLPSAVQGSEASLENDNTKVSISYIDRFKQRSSSYFTNIIEHALGSDTKSVIGNARDYTVSLALKYKDENIDMSIYDLYANDFINTIYADISYKENFYKFSAQVVSQKSIGNADDNIAMSDSVTKGKRINSNGIGLRTQLDYKEASFDLVYRNIFRDKSSYDSIITPWDGTLLYAYSSTTNNLGQSLYGNALTAGGAYVGGTQGVKLSYTQKYDFLALKGIKTHIAYARYINPEYREDQEDLKIFLAYKLGKISWQIKGIWIDNDTYTFKDGTINQLDVLTQYHVIANYKF